MELEIELNDYVDHEYGEYGAVLCVTASVSKCELTGQTVVDLDETATLFTSDQDGGERRELEVETSEYLTPEQALEYI